MKTMAACLVLGTAAALAGGDSMPGADPIVTCRNAHAEDVVAHIACLEQALRSRDAAISPESSPTIAAGELGAEQVRASSRDESSAPEQIEVRIATVAYTADGYGEFLMTDGQQWRETEKAPQGQRLRLGQQYTAQIQRGRLGGYRMYIDGVRRMIKVKRVK